MKLRRLDDRGATAIEYGVIAALIGLGLVAALTNTRGSLNKDFNCIASGVDGQGASGCSATLPTPTTALGYAMQMVPAGRSVTGTTKDNQGRSFNFFTLAPNPPVDMGGSYDPSLSPSYHFSGVKVADNVYQVTSYGGSPTVVASGTVTYGIVTPKGWIMVDTQPSP
jgi:pilus assembly protein Flp/PilA